MTTSRTWESKTDHETELSTEREVKKLDQQSNKVTRKEHGSLEVGGGKVRARVHLMARGARGTLKVNGGRGSQARWMYLNVLWCNGKAAGSTECTMSST